MKIFLSCSFLLIFLCGCSFSYDDSSKEPVKVVSVNVYSVSDIKIFILEVEKQTGKKTSYIEYSPNAELIKMKPLLPAGTEINIQAILNGNLSDIKVGDNIPHHKIKSITLIPGGEKYNF